MCQKVFLSNKISKSLMMRDNSFFNVWKCWFFSFQVGHLSRFCFSNVYLSVLKMRFTTFFTCKGNCDGKARWISVQLVLVHLVNLLQFFKLLLSLAIRCLKCFGPLLAFLNIDYHTTYKLACKREIERLRHFV